MRKILSVITAISILPLMQFSVIAESETSITNEVSSSLVTEEISTYNCRTKDITTKTISFESQHDNADLSKSGRTQVELYSEPEVVNDLEYDISSDLITVSTYSNALERINNPHNYGQYRSTVYIDTYVKKDSTVKLSDRGTGFVVGPNTVVTAGHVINNKNYGKENINHENWAYKVVVYPARSGFTCPYGSASSTELICSTEWTNNQNADHDWGIIRLDKNIGDDTGWLGLYYQSSSFHGTTIDYAGYPTMSLEYRYLYRGYARQTNFGSSGLVYAGDGVTATGGMSGSPAFIYRNQSGYTAIGIVVHSCEGGFGYVKLSEWLYNELVSYRNKRCATYK